MRAGEGKEDIRLEKNKYPIKHSTHKYWINGEKLGGSRDMKSQKHTIYIGKINIKKRRNKSI